jgi:hypothetical protein
MAVFIRQLPNGAHPRGSACFNSKLSHLINQRGTRQSKPIGRASLPSDQPVGLLQCFEDMLPLGVGKRARRCVRWLLRHLLQVFQRDADRPSVMVIRSAVLGGPGGTAAICATSPRSQASDTARAPSQLVRLVVLRMNLPASVPDTQMVQSHSFQER